MTFPSTLGAIRGPVDIQTTVETWRMAEPFEISGHVFESIDLVKVRLVKDGVFGQAEARGIYYRGDTAETVVADIERVRAEFSKNCTSQFLQQALPPGGARNALDCALWDLFAKLERTPVWRLLGMNEPVPLLTTITCGADTPERMAAAATSLGSARALKLKLTGETIDAARVRSVREARPDVWLAVDANQGLSQDSLSSLMPTLVDCGVTLIEQPFPIGQEDLLMGLQTPIRFAADESIQSAQDIPRLVGRFEIINIKLDKCGGLTEALEMVRAARSHGLDVMVGNMLGTSLAMAPAFVIGQLCDIVDLDGPILLAEDRKPAASYRDGTVFCSGIVWGGGVAAPSG